MSEKQEPLSPIRHVYVIKLILRILVFISAVAVFFWRPDWLNVLEGDRFFREFSPLHLLWLVWVVDMLWQLIPVKNHIPLGSQKLFRQRFRPITEKINRQALKNYVVSTTKAAYKVMIVWGLLIAAIGLLYYTHVLNARHLFLISVAFYVCDLICVLIWCPFRLMMRTRCCTTCRIFNWDHLMMFTPMLFIGSVYALSLLALALAVWVLWELCILLYPERFWEQTNVALRCSECTDKLCTQYCRKLRK